ncbi:MAG: right-handed parallel beta-helix repeat-containing protein, partial [Coriobacteriales bacterium]|nr:right-handed parallel beta-helix repeat-containing protein [Coriobacteriales bacterium]
TITGSGYVVDFNVLGTGSDSTLRGFTVSGGTRGIQSNGSDVTVSDCVVEGNAIGVYHQGSSADPIVVDDCTIQDNTGYGFQSVNGAAVVTLRDCTLSGNAGGIASNGGSDYRIERCDVISNNAGSANGAGMLNSAAGITLRISDSLFASNTTNGNGAALYLQANSATIERTTFRDNTAGGFAGAIYAFGGTSAMTFSDCFVDGNTAGTNGGGIVLGGGNIQVRRTCIRGNRSNNTANGGGGLYTTGTGTWLFENCTFSGNYANFNGGGAYLSNLGTTMLNCTFSGNSANLGGGIYATPNANGSLKARNCVLYGDDSRIGAIEEIDGTNLARFELTYSDINQAFGGFYNQVGNMTANPEFASPVAPGSATVAGDYHLQAGTPCNGAADEAIAPADDIDGDPRAHVSDEMGSDELN